MSWREFPEIGERCYETRLENGLTIRVVPKSGFARKYAFLAVDFGAIDTDFAVNGQQLRVPDGIAHYLEHKMFDLPDANASALFGALGGNPNAFTSYSMTAYHFSCTEHFEENLQVLLRMVMTPCFPEDSVEKERGIIAQEIKMYEDSAESRVAEDMFAALFASHPIRVPIAGTVESIADITGQTLLDCYNAFYRPSNMILCVTGDVDADRVRSIAEAFSPGASAPLPSRNYGSPECMNPVRPRTERYMEVSMPTFSIGFKCAPVEQGLSSMRREVIGDLAAEVLVGESSPLYQRLYEEGLIDSAFSAGYESVKDACLLSFSGDSTDPEAVLQAIVQEAEGIVADGVCETLFQRLKRSALGRRMRALDSFEGICYQICAYYFEGADYFRFPAVYASVSAEDVRSFLRETVRPERAVLSVVRPREQEGEHGTL